MKLVYGVGVNDADFKTTEIRGGASLRCPPYAAWCNMLARCYGKKEIERHPTYHGVVVCDEWRSFMKFREWWMDHHVDGWHLDKDLLTDSRVYSASTCIYVPQWLNKFISCGGNRHAGRLAGASMHAASGKFRSGCGNPITGEYEYLGLYDDEVSAHYAWLSRKLAIASGAKADMDSIDARIYTRVCEIILRM